MEPISPTTFSASGIRERQDLQAVLRDNPEAIAPGLMVLSEEFSNWEDSASRIDLLCLDRDANLAVVELKRDDSRTMDGQAIRYAAMISAMGFEDVVSAHADYVAKRGRSDVDSRRAIREFLGLAEDEDATISSKPRIILLASSFSMSIRIDLPHDKLADFCRRWNVTELSFFGSVTRDDFADDSDVDIMVDFASGKTPGLDFWDMEAELEEILGHRVDLTTRQGVENSANYIIRGEILRSVESYYAEPIGLSVE